MLADEKQKLNNLLLKIKVKIHELTISAVFLLGGESMDQGNDDVIVVESLDHNIPESFIVPSSRSPSPNPRPLSPASVPAPAPLNKQDKTL